MNKYRDTNTNAIADPIINDAAASSAIDELNELIDGLTPEAAKRAADFTDAISKEPHKLFIVKGEGSLASRAPGDVVFLEPSPLFRELLATLRALKGD